jgi:hypothetical protein
MNNRLLVQLVGCFLLATSPLRAQNRIVITVEGGKSDLQNVPVCVPLSLPKDQANFVRAHIALEGREAEGQLTAPGLATEHLAPSAKGLVRRDLHFILPALRKGEWISATAKLIKANNAPDITGFLWLDQKKAEATDLIFDVLSGARRRPVLRYMHGALDDSTKEKRNQTYKVFHHLFDPEGKRLVTNGGHADPYTNEKTLLYPHHRGLMFAFSKITYGEGLKKKADTWHCTGDAYQSHEKVVNAEGGFVLGRHRVIVDWHGEKKEVFAREERELTVYNLPGGNLVEFASRLKTTGGKVRLDGDPQHAGFQFRAANEVAGKESAKQTYYLRPDGNGALGATRNWDPKTKAGPVDLPWDAMSFVLGGKRYTVAYLNSPNNPKESRFSERDYGRFGCYFEYDLTAEHPLVVNYRVWLQDGEMKGEQVEALYDAFTHPPRITVKK